MALQIGTTLHDRYRIDEKLAEGGMGAVYRGWDTHLKFTCAIKENLASRRYSDMAEELARQFEREATLVASLRHPNLPRVTDHFIIGDAQYLVMDFIEGDDLAARLRRVGQLPEKQVLAWMAQVCDALTYLHSRPQAPIIHRDIKPQNIKITPDGYVLLVDFGLSKVYDPHQSTVAGARGWTTGFSPPEQYDLGHTDARSDEYSLGATLYTLLTGHAPPDALELRLGYAKLRPPRELNPSVSERTSAAILRAMALDAAARFESVAEFRAALLGPGWSVREEAPPAPPTTLAPAAPAARLVSKTAREYCLQPMRNLIGRRNRQTGEVPEVDLSEEPESDTVSRKHAQIDFRAGEWHLEPCPGHKNVIKVNGRRVDQSGSLIRAGDELKVGAVVLRFETGDGRHEESTTD